MPAACQPHGGSLRAKNPANVPATPSPARAPSVRTTAGGFRPTAEPFLPRGLRLSPLLRKIAGNRTQRGAAFGGSAGASPSRVFARLPFGISPHAEFEVPCDQYLQDAFSNTDVGKYIAL
ncbi:MAG: hypothetical protein ACKO2L_12945 [Planctomycetaceae bacterium]